MVKGLSFLRWVGHHILHQFSDTAPGVGNVSLIAGDNMHMQVKDGLAGGGTAIYPDIVAVRTVSGIEYLFYREGQFVERSDLFRGSFEKAGHMSFGYNQNMAFVDRVLIVEGLGQFVFADKIRAGPGAKNTFFGHHKPLPHISGLPADLDSGDHFKPAVQLFEVYLFHRE